MFIRASAKYLFAPAERNINLSRVRRLEERFAEPAKLAGRLLAPGEGSAEPGDAKPKMLLSHEVCDRCLSPASQALLDFAKVTPRLGGPRQGLHFGPPASQARLMRPPTYFSPSAKTISKTRFYGFVLQAVETCNAALNFSSSIRLHTPERLAIESC